MSKKVPVPKSTKVLLWQLLSHLVCNAFVEGYVSNYIFKFEMYSLLSGFWVKRLLAHCLKVLKTNFFDAPANK